MGVVLPYSTHIQLNLTHKIRLLWTSTEDLHIRVKNNTHTLENDQKAYVKYSKKNTKIPREREILLNYSFWYVILSVDCRIQVDFGIGVAKKIIHHYIPLRPTRYLTRFCYIFLNDSFICFLLSFILFSFQFCVLKKINEANRCLNLRYFKLITAFVKSICERCECIVWPVSHNSVLISIIMLIVHLNQRFQLIIFRISNKV